MEFRIQDPDQMHDLGIALAKVLKAGDLLLLNGPLGAGKTTLTRGIGEGLGAQRLEALAVVVVQLLQAPAFAAFDRLDRVQRADHLVVQPP